MRPREPIARFMAALADDLTSGTIGGRDALLARKRELARRFRLSRIPGNTEICRYIQDRGGITGDPEVHALLAIKPSRGASGVCVVSVMTPPERCPHGRCIYCPGGVDAGTPQGYTGYEPAALRGREFAYDGSAQTRARLEQIRSAGHVSDKVDLIIMGGTFTSMRPDAQRSFVRSCLDGLNARPSLSLEDAVRANETARSRCIGLTVETRPDVCEAEHIDLMLSYGTTRVEIGVQTLHQETLDRIGRRHTLDDVIRATRMAKDAGLKVGYHMMPGLPGEDPGSDTDAFWRLFHTTGYMPDMLKIYPTLVMKGTPLYGMYLRGEYAPYTAGQCIDLLAKVKGEVPRWVRISRIQRDIPAQHIVAGCRRSDLRARVLARMRDIGSRCMCIRCREVGRRPTTGTVEGRPEVRMDEYMASGGSEMFISMEEGDVLYGYVRLRYPSDEAHRPEVRSGGGQTALVRELRVLGQTVPLGARVKGRPQHRGMGAQLLEWAEERARQDGYTRMLVMSGIGVRPYFRRLGYMREGPYMGKAL